MKGIALDCPIRYLHASLRFFSEGEKHIDRIIGEDVLLLVFDGCLRFSEDGVPFEVRAGEYYIQHAGGRQRGEVPSDSPRYLYVHFCGEWADVSLPHVLPHRGRFSCDGMMPLIEETDRLAHGDGPKVEPTAALYRILTRLFRGSEPGSEAEKILHYITEHCSEPLSLSGIADRFHFSKNYVIRLLNDACGMTPIRFLNLARLKRAEYLLEVTSLTVGEIAEQCGYRHYSHFYRQFYQKNRRSPAEWRKNRRCNGSIPRITEPYKENRYANHDPGIR